MTTTALDFMTWTWADIEPQYAALAERSLSPTTVEAFLHDWSALADRVSELGSRLHVAADANTADEAAAARYADYVESIAPRTEEAEQRLKRRLLDSGLEPDGLAVPLRRLRAEVQLFREENVPLQAEEKLLVQEYFRITGAQTISWDGEEIPLARVRALLEEPDRARRERAWRLRETRREQDYTAIDDVWRRLLHLRQQIAANAGFPDYRSYRWHDLKRFDYTPEDSQRFHRSVETVVVPVVARLYDGRREQLNLSSLRPWDVNVDVQGRPPVRPYRDAAELAETCAAVFHRVDPVLGGYFDTMRREGLLDLASRPNKRPGGYCTVFSASGRPYIHMLEAGTKTDVETLLHEMGHAFHAFETTHLPYHQQRGMGIPMEFLEVASMAMELLAEPFLPADRGGFYSPEDAARARIDHLVERILVLWGRLAVGDALQHWVYQHPQEATDTARMDAVYADLVQRFLPGIDWSGLEREMAGSWREIPHVFAYPFYVIEYAFALLGAVQIWVNAQRDQAEALRRYRHALSLGGTRTLPELYAAAGARFAFDEDTLRDAVGTIERALTELQGA